MSIYIRTKASRDGYVVCVTCETTKPIAEMDCGHFLPKSVYPGVRFVEENCHPQCIHCNRFNEAAAMIEFTRYMQLTYGDSFIDELKREGLKTKQLRVPELLEIEAHYKRKFDELELVTEGA